MIIFDVIQGKVSLQRISLVSKLISASRCGKQQSHHSNAGDTPFWFVYLLFQTKKAIMEIAFGKFYKFCIELNSVILLSVIQWGND